MYKYVGLLFFLLPAQLFRADSLAEHHPNINRSEKLSHSTCASLSGNCLSLGRGLRKCCHKNEVFLSELKCVNLSVNVTDGQLISNSISQFSEYNVKLSCPNNSFPFMMPLNETHGDVYDRYSNGTIYHWNYNLSYPYEQYCFEYFVRDHKCMPVVCVGGSEEGEPKFDSMEQQSYYNLMKYQKYGLNVSIVFLIATLGLFLATPKLRKSVHDRCFLCHVVSLIIGFSSLIGIKELTPANDYCTLLAYMTQFWLLACFFWLNVLCIHMWRKINVDKLLKHSLERNPNCTFISYCLYAWGCPLLVSGITFEAQFLLPLDSRWRPNLGVNVCWFEQYNDEFWFDPTFLYFYGVISVTLLINWYAFVDSALILFFRNKFWKPGNNRESQRNGKQQKMFFLYFKCFLLMGLNWITETASYYFKGTYGLWSVTDLVNTFQGVIIFLIFVVYNERVKLSLKEHFLGKRDYTQCKVKVQV